MPPDVPLRTLGWLKHLEDPMFPYYEHYYLVWLQWTLTDGWWILQHGMGQEALSAWLRIMKFLELDMKAMRDLFLLAQAGYVGRTHANKVLWNILSGPACDPKYQDLSNLVTNLVYQARRDFDRPPREHRDLRWWDWSCYRDLWPWDRRWAPTAAPNRPWHVVRGPGGKPLPPPDCWGLQ